MGALKRFVDKHFGMLTQAYVLDITTAAGIKIALPNNPDRLMFTLMNLSDTNVYVAPDKGPSATSGILITSAGGSISLSAAIDGELVGYEWNVYCTDAAKAIFAIVTEGTT